MKIALLIEYQTYCRALCFDGRPRLTLNCAIQIYNLSISYEKAMDQPIGLRDATSPVTQAALVQLPSIVSFTRLVGFRKHWCVPPPCGCSRKRTTTLFGASKQTRGEQQYRSRSQRGRSAARMLNELGEFFRKYAMVRLCYSKHNIVMLNFNN